ncbi:hypothetical protein ACFLW8_03375 [Chloroflexota bacterium]
MPDYYRLNREFLIKIETGLGEIRNIPTEDRHDAITDLLANVSLSPDEKLKLRRQLLREFAYPPKDFDEVFGCRFSVLMWEKIGRGN